MDKLNWIKDDYFPMFAKAKEDTAAYPLEMLVDDLHTSKERTVNRFLCHPGSEDFLWGLCNLLKSKSTRIAGNTAYIIGTLAESDVGCYRILALATKRQTRCPNILESLINMLDYDDTETVMNAAGTMGTLAESHEGREWVLKEPCMTDMIRKVTTLLRTDNIWTASNAALVLARLTIAETGCESLLKHELAATIIAHLVASLGVDEAGRGMNAAFALGRLCDTKDGLELLLKASEKERMMGLLHRMLTAADHGSSKNACFCLSCVAGSSPGHALVLSSPRVDEMLTLLSQLILADEEETAWFAGMTLRTLASQPKGCLRLRGHPNVVPSLHMALKKCMNKSGTSDDLREECTNTLAILKPPDKPNAPEIKVTGATSVMVSWPAVKLKSGFPVKYHLYQDQTLVYDGDNNSFHVQNLIPNNQYAFRIRVYTEADRSPCSDQAACSTEESVPSEPCNFRPLVITTSQAKVTWDPPERPNGLIKHYIVYNGDKVVEQTSELSTIVSSLQFNSTYILSVCACTSKGKGPRAKLNVTTLELGTHAPSKPTLNVLGRNEVSVSWDPPEHPLGRINRYEVCLDREKVVYSGTDTFCKVKGLTADTEYTVTVVVLTNEGKFEGKPSKKRTSKDEYSDTQRAPLYEPSRRDSEAGSESRKTSIASMSVKSANPKPSNSQSSSSSKTQTVSSKESCGELSEASATQLPREETSVKRKQAPAPNPPPIASPSTTTASTSTSSATVPIPVKTVKLNRNSAATLEEPQKRSPLVSDPSQVTQNPPSAQQSRKPSVAKPKTTTTRSPVRYISQKRRSLPSSSVSVSTRPPAKPNSASLTTNGSAQPSTRKTASASHASALVSTVSTVANSDKGRQKTNASQRSNPQHQKEPPPDDRKVPTQSQSLDDKEATAIQQEKKMLMILKCISRMAWNDSPLRTAAESNCVNEDCVAGKDSHTGFVEPMLETDNSRHVPQFPHRSRTFAGGSPNSTSTRSRSLSRASLPSMPSHPASWSPEFPGVTLNPASKAFIPLHKRSQSSHMGLRGQNRHPLSQSQDTLASRSRTFIEVRSNQQLLGEDYSLKNRPLMVPVNSRSVGRDSPGAFSECPRLPKQLLL